ncbi:helix-turn-helix transcriptional regulator [Kocuria sabuli]|uniref:helix-turn-helix transcriptional regulator n=1 Tax=Kocuria sabuli TaxID=3071448 RepID=UPI0034D5D5E1
MKLVTVAKAAEAVDMSDRSIHRLLDEGRLTAYRLSGGRAVRVDLNELLALFGAAEQ